MTVGAIILCRLSSLRLPGKVLKPLQGQQVLLHIVNRLKLVSKLDEIIIATSTEKSDDQIEEFCKLHDLNCYRGSLLNVAERFLKCAETFQLDYAIRINGDNVLIDVQTINDMIKLTATNTVGLITNVPGRSFPFGMSVEILNVSFFDHIFVHLSDDSRYQEHVTIYFYEHLEDFESQIQIHKNTKLDSAKGCLLYTSPSPRDRQKSRMPSSA